MERRQRHGDVVIHNREDVLKKLRYSFVVYSNNLGNAAIDL